MCVCGVEQQMYWLVGVPIIASLLWMLRPAFAPNPQYQSDHITVKQSELKVSRLNNITVASNVAADTATAAMLDGNLIGLARPGLGTRNVGIGVLWSQQHVERPSTWRYKKNVHAHDKSGTVQVFLTIPMIIAISPSPHLRLHYWAKWRYAQRSRVRRGFRSRGEIHKTRGRDESHNLVQQCGQLRWISRWIRLGLLCAPHLCIEMSRLHTLALLKTRFLPSFMGWECVAYSPMD